MFEYPHARRSQTVESFNSTTADSDSISQVWVPNPYDWLEDVSSDETREFVAARNATLDGYLSADTSGASAKNRLMTLLQTLVQGEVVSMAPQSAGQYYLLRVSGCGRAFPVTVKIGKQDLQTFLQSSGSTNTSLSTQTPLDVFHDESDNCCTLLTSGVSKSGKYWAYSTSVKGSDWGVIRVKETETGRVFRDEICDTKFNNTIKPISWWGDLGFFYQSWQLCAEQNTRPQLRYHALGTCQADDKVIYEDNAHPGYCFWLQVSDDEQIAFLSIYSAGQTCQVRAARISNLEEQPNFNTEVCNSFDYKWEYIGRILRKGQQLYVFHTDRNNGEIVGLSLCSTSASHVLLVEGIDAQTLKLAHAIGEDYILLVRSIDVRDRLQLLSIADEKVTTVDSPIDTVFRVDYDSARQNIFIIESSFSRPFSLWHIDGKRLVISSADSVATRPIKLYPELHTNAAGVSNKQVFYSSADDTKVPMFLVSDDIYPISADTPVLLYVYGGFGISVIPHFRPDFLAFIKAFRGVVAFANVRGGGEYGRSWYLAACKKRRQRVLDDIHGALKYLIDTLGVKRKPVLMGESMGALNSMSAIVQHPNLVSAAILNAGPFDVLHRRNTGMGIRGLEDIGDEKVPDEFAAIFKWSPLENVRVGHKYPPALFTAGDQDDLVRYSNSCKMVATLQYVQKQLEGNSATHLRICENLGHGGAISAVKAASISVERWLWLKTTLKLKIYDE